MGLVMLCQVPTEVTVAEQAKNIVLKVALHAIRGGVKYHVLTTVRHTILVVVTATEEASEVRTPSLLQYAIRCTRDPVHLLGMANWRLRDVYALTTWACFLTGEAKSYYEVQQSDCPRC
jgi:hypothetical protein